MVNYVNYVVLSFNILQLSSTSQEHYATTIIILKDHVHILLYTDNIDAMDQRYLLTCSNPYDTMKIGGVFRYGLKSLQYDCDRR